MFKLLKKSYKLALSIIAVVFTVLPESIFAQFQWFPNAPIEANVVITRVLACIVILMLTIWCVHCRKSLRIKGHNYNIKIEYGDILQVSNCKKIIPFDECFTTKVGDSPEDINSASLCGQYLKEKPIQDMQALIDLAKLKPTKRKSKYQKNQSYESGKIVPRKDDLLMAFAKLNLDGRGALSRDEFLDCLFTLWKEIDKHYGQNDVCIPILGSGTTRIGDNYLTRQQCLDIIIGSYKLSAYKIPPPYQLRILCKKDDEKDDFSLNKIGETL